MYARLTIATVTLLVSISEAGAQSRDDDFWGAVTIGEQFGQQAGAVLSSAVAMRQQSARATAEIQASRRLYWDALASGRDVENGARGLRREAVEQGSPLPRVFRSRGRARTDGAARSVVRKSGVTK
jgi:hypothetical protein